MSIEYVELTIEDAAPIEITISDIPEAGSGGSLSPIAARSLLGNSTNASALPTGISDPAVLQSIVQCPSEAEFDSFVSLVGASFTAVDTALAARVLNTDTRLADSREWTASTISQAEAEAGTATTRRAFTAQRVRQAIVGWWDEDSFGERLGLIYDLPNGQSALQCADSEWVFGNTSYRDNLRIALQAAASSHTHGNITNAGAIGTTADLPLSTTASGVINTRTVAEFRGLLNVNTERIQVALSANGQNISAGTKKGVIPILIAGTITAFRIDCDPANEPSAIAVQCDLNRINRTTGVATSVLSSVASIATGANTGSGTVNGTQSVAVGDMLTIDIDQGSDGRELIASITITLS